MAKPAKKRSKAQKLKVADKNYRFLKTSKKRNNVLFGGAGSAKSWSVAIFILMELLIRQDNIRILIVRRTTPEIKKSCWLLIRDLMQKFGIKANVNRSDLIIRLGSSEIFFVALDDIEKLKSIEGINYIWAEEASELTKWEYLQLNLRCRGKNPHGINRLFWTFNPIDEYSYWKELVTNPSRDVAVCHSTYKDNPFLDDKYVETIESLKDQDETYWKIYGQGEFATPANIIYTNWSVIDDNELPEEPDEKLYGVDFGYNAPSAVIELNIKDKVIYLCERVYQSYLTNPELIEKCKELTDTSCQFVGDKAEPDRIKEFCQAGLSMTASKSGNGIVNYGITLCKAQDLRVTEGSVNLIKEFKSYKWKEDREGNVKDEPLKFADHALDAMRYGVYHVRRRVKAGLTIVTEDKTESELERIEDEAIWE